MNTAASLPRTDLYTTVHKALRAALCEAAVAVGRTDFADAAASARAHAAVASILAFLREHAEHEDTVIGPELDRLSPELALLLHEEHVRMEGKQLELDKLLARLTTAAAAERVALGPRLHGRLWSLVADQLVHMEREESQANRLLWAHCTDAVLDEMHGRIVGSIPPARLTEWLPLLLAAAAPAEADALRGVALELGL